MQRSPRDITHQEQEREIRDSIDGPIDQQEFFKIDTPTWSEITTEGEPEVASRCTFENKNDGGCCFKRDEESTASGKDAPKRKDREDSVLE